MPSLHRANTIIRRTGATIRLDQSFIDALTGVTKASDKRYTWNILTIDDASALLRTKFQLAMIMLHEYLHSVWQARYSLFAPGIPNSRYPNDGWSVSREPYFLDHRDNELGHAFIAELLGGIISPNGRYAATVPYGLHTSRWPGIRDSTPTTLFSAAKWGMGWQTFYLCPMDYIQRIFTKQFWDKEVERQGMLGALTVPRELGVRRYNDGQFYANESPTGKMRQALFGLHVDDDYSDDDGFDPETWVLTRGRYKGQLGRVLKRKKKAGDRVRKSFKYALGRVGL